MEKKSQQKSEFRKLLPIVIVTECKHKFYAHAFGEFYDVGKVLIAQTYSIRTFFFHSPDFSVQ